MKLCPLLKQNSERGFAICFSQVARKVFAFKYNTITILHSRISAHLLLYETSYGIRKHTTGDQSGADDTGKSCGHLAGSELFG
jgi:hypothetical protein